MYYIGALLFLIGGIIMFGSDRLYRKGKITSLKSLLKIKSLGLILTILAALFMINPKF